MLDAMAERYGCLPTFCLQHANTLDLQVFDLAASYRQHIQQKQDGGTNASQYTEEDLLAATRSMKNENGPNPV